MATQRENCTESQHCWHGPPRTGPPTLARRYLVFAIGWHAITAPGRSAVGGEHRGHRVHAAVVTINASGDVVVDLRVVHLPAARLTGVCHELLDTGARVRDHVIPCRPQQVSSHIWLPVVKLTVGGTVRERLITRWFARRRLAQIVDRPRTIYRLINEDELHTVTATTICVGWAIS